jgi:pyrroline-5-carboxylate reductase
MSRFILTVKPYQVDIVLADILPKIKNKTIASAVSGLSIEVLQGKIGDGNHAMRIMPNIASRFGESATCISFSENNKAQSSSCYYFIRGSWYGSSYR